MLAPKSPPPPPHPLPEIEPTTRDKKGTFFLVSSLFFSHVHFNVPSVLSVPISRNTWDRTVPAICGQIYCFRRLRTRRIASAEFFTFSLPCSLPRSHATVLVILLIEYIFNVAEVRHVCAPSPPPPLLPIAHSRELCCLAC